MGATSGGTCWSGTWARGGSGGGGGGDSWVGVGAGAGASGVGWAVAMAPAFGTAVHRLPLMVVKKNPSRRIGPDIVAV